MGSYDGSVPMDQQLQLNQSNIVWTGGLSEVGYGPHCSPELNCFIKKYLYKQQSCVFFVFRFLCLFAVIPAHLEADKPDAQENLSAALTAYHAQKER